MRIDLGGGTQNTKAPGHVNIDITPMEGVDIVWDLNNGLPMKELGRMMAETKGYANQLTDPIAAIRGQVEGIRCHQVIEHLNTIIPMMNDCFEVMKSGAILEISTPLAGTDPFWQDPTHKKGYIRRSFDYFCDDETTKDAREEYGITCKFKVVWELLEHGWNLQIHLEKP